MSKLLITGGSKGIGAAIKCKLQDEYEITDISRTTGYDLSKISGIEKAQAKIKKLKPDVVILNHGVWDNKKIVRINLEAPMALARFARWIMIKNHIEGQIVFILSNSAYDGFAGNEEYSATKAGLLGFARCLYKSCVNFGIKVSTISPGTVNTDMWKQSRTDNRKKCIPIEPWEMGEAVATTLKLSSCVTEMKILPRPKETL